MIDTLAELAGFGAVLCLTRALALWMNGPYMTRQLDKLAQYLETMEHQTWR